MMEQWQDRQCREDPEAFFPMAAPGTAMYDAEVSRAVQLCHACPMLDLCREMYLDLPEGIVGGLTPEQRAAQIRRVRAVA